MGVDPALAETGFVVVDFFSGSSQDRENIRLVEEGVIKTSFTEVLPQRLKKIYSEMEKIIVRYPLDAAVVEKVYSHWRHPQTASLLGHVRAAVVLSICMSNIPLFEYSTTHIRKSLTGRGNASRRQVRGMIEFITGKRSRSPHIEDALSLVVAHIHTLKC